MKIQSKEIQLVSIDSLIPYQKNMNKHTPEQIQWKELVGTIYLVSSDGQFKNKKNGYLKKQTPTKDGYLTVNIQGKTKQSHRLVAKVWLDDYSEDLVVNHLDFNRKNNNFRNLQMCKAADNQKYSAKFGRYKRYGERNNNCKISTSIVLEIKRNLDLGFSCAEISRRMKISRRYINSIKLGKRRTNG